MFKIIPFYIVAVGSCLDPGIPGNGRRILSGTGVGDKVQFVCHDGFELQGSAELVCQNNGKWSGPIPTCIKGESLYIALSYVCIEIF